jgi:4-hydroxy-tetrahydrodipicolinate synthase
MPTVYAAIATPLDTQGAFDPPAMTRLLDTLYTSGVDGVVPCGTTGEGPSFSVSERLAIIQHCVAHRAGHRVIAGTGCQSLTDTISLTAAACAAGVDACLVLPPFFYKQSGEHGVLDWYRALCDALPIGSKLILYHIPPMTGVPITPTIIDGLLATHPAYIAGIKDSGVDAAHTAMLTARYPQLAIYTGNAPILAQAIRDGAAGSILAIANIVPTVIRTVTDDPSRTDAQAQLAAVDGFVRKVGAVATIKAILAGAGTPVGAPLPPQRPHPDAGTAYREFLACTSQA